MCMSLEYSASLYHPPTQLSISTASNVSEEGLETRPCSCLCTRNFFDDMIYSGTVARACLLLCSHFVGLKTNKHPRCIFELSLHPWLPMTMHLLLCNLYLCSLYSNDKCSWSHTATSMATVSVATLHQRYH